MIEIVYKEEKQEARGNEAFFSLPKNIRQIGDTKGTRKIYMEDYVYTFLKKLCQGNGRGGRAAILFGKYKWSEGQDYLFIQSAMEPAEMDVSAEHIQFTDRVWSEVHDTAEKYFEDQDILGWFLCLPQSEFEITDLITRTHLNHFAGNDKVLFMMEPSEREEAFFSYEGGRLVRESGYYIYYEKNEPMQEYMIAHGENCSVEEQDTPGDRAVTDFRRVIGKNQEEKKETAERSGRSMVYTLAACVAVAVLAVGVSYARDAGIWSGIFGEQSSRTAEETAAGAQGQRAETPGEENTGESALTDGPEETGDQAPETKPEEGAGSDEKSQDTGREEEEETEETGAPGKNGEGTDTEKEESQSETETGSTKAEDTELQTANGTGTGEKNEGNTNTGGEDTKAAESGNGQASASVQTTVTAREYTVQKGDTLSKICMAVYGNLSKVDEICALNHLSDAGLIFEGQKLVLP